MKRILIIALLVAVGCGTDQPSAKATTQGAKLASIEAGVIVDDSDPRSRWFNNSLKNMAVTYGEDEVGISDGLVKAQSILKKYEIQITLRTLAKTMNVAEGMNGFAKGTKKRDFNKIVSSYILMRKNLISHSEASITTRGLIAGGNSVP